MTKSKTPKVTTVNAVHTLETEDAGLIDNHNDFNDALLEKQANIDVEPNPYLEVSQKLFSALSKGRNLRSMTYGDPGVRVYPHGAKDVLDQEEKMPADKFRELEIRRISETANK